MDTTKKTLADRIRENGGLSLVLEMLFLGLLLLLFAPVLAAAYGFLYAALQSEDYALLIGSLGLFAILAGVMVLTRKVDWHRLGSRNRSRGGQGKEAEVHSEQ
jgi:inner membrane protein involved in colicin E2 resistance